MVDQYNKLQVLIVMLLIKQLSCSDISWNGNWAFACDWTGHDLADAKSRGEDCGGLCARTQGCTHFTWTTYNGGTCWMKKDSVTKNDAFSTGDRSMVCGINAESSTPTAGINWNGNWAFSCDWTGHDLADAKSRGEDCGGLCARTQGCTHFTWTTYNGGTCWMKKDSVTKNDAFATGDKSMVCGIVTAGSGPVLVPTPTGFPGCGFKTGRAFDSNLGDYGDADYITIWINTISNDFGTDFNPWYQGKMIDTCKNTGKIPVFYAYVIAFQARHDKNLQDCNVDPNWNLCNHGAEYIRNNRALLVSRYTHQASKIAERLGRDKTCVFLMEPDFWQYYGNNRQSGGTLSGEYMRDLYNDFVREIKKYLPNAFISWDISAWIGEAGFQTWFNYFRGSQIDFVNTSGGETTPESNEMKPGELRWSFVSQVTGKKIIADCGYGAGGGANGNCWRWRNSGVLQNRNSDGVIALTQGSDYQSLPNKPRWC